MVPSATSRQHEGQMVIMARLLGWMIATLALASLLPGPAAAQVSGALPRTADGKPDLSGIWQAVTTANWNIQAHSAEKDVPAGLGIVDGDEIPYQPWAAAKKRENFANRATADPDAR